MCFSDSPTTILMLKLQVHKGLKKDKWMADLQMIFTEEKVTRTYTLVKVKVDGGVTFASMFCSSPFLCVFLRTCLLSYRDTNVPLQNCFFKGSISMRWTHIA